MKKNHKKIRQIAAWAVIILLAALVIAALIFALIDTPWSFTAFKICLGCALILPILLYVYTWAVRVFTKDQDDSL